MGCDVVVNGGLGVVEVWSKCAATFAAAMGACLAMAEAHVGGKGACRRDGEHDTWTTEAKEPPTRRGMEGRTAAREETPKENPGGRMDVDEG